MRILSASAFQPVSWYPPLMRRWHVVALAVLLSACGSDQERRGSHLERAEIYLEEDKTQEALIELKNALALAPNPNVSVSSPWAM